MTFPIYLDDKKSNIRMVNSDQGINGNRMVRKKGNVIIKFLHYSFYAIDKFTKIIFCKINIILICNGS